MPSDPQPSPADGATDPAPELSVRSLHPGNFALVMASGILSVGFHTLHFDGTADAMALFAGAAWLVLLALSLWRLWRHAGAVRADLLNPRMVFSYFTLVAATSIVGLLLQQRGHDAAAMVCWVLASRPRSGRMRCT